MRPMPGAIAPGGPGLMERAKGSMANTPGAHVSLADVTHRYRRGQGNAVENISLQIEPSEAVALIGRSGCGKSTLLHVMAGLLMPTRGVAYVDGRPVDGPSPRWIVMFQQASLYPWMTVRQNAALGLRFTGRKKEAKTRVPELLDLVELGDLADRNVQDLSGGQQQRVALARSLAVHPEVLLLDEPFSALDTFTRAALQRDVRRIAKEIGITLVLVTHNINEAVTMADRALVMSANPGRVRSELAIPLSDRERQRPGSAFQEVRAALQRDFEDVAGVEAASLATIPPGKPAEAGDELEQRETPPAGKAMTAVAV